MNNNSYLNNKSFKNSQAYSLNQEYIPLEKSYIENILRINKGKKVSVYQTFKDKDAVFKGIIERCGKDHIILSDPNSGKWYFLLMMYIDYIEFDEEINSVDQFYAAKY